MPPLRRTATVLAVAQSLATGTGTGTAAAKPNCSFRAWDGPKLVVDCLMNVRKHTSRHDELAHCSGYRMFHAWDHSDRVELEADGRWIAPNTSRMRAYGSPLGSLRVIFRSTYSDKFSVRNRSAFGVIVRFTATCETS